MNNTAAATADCVLQQHKRTVFGVLRVQLGVLGILHPSIPRLLNLLPAGLVAAVPAAAELAAADNVSSAGKRERRLNAKGLNSAVQALHMPCMCRHIIADRPSMIWT